MEEEYASSSQATKKLGKQHNTLPIWGNESTMNLNPLVLANIQSSSYFKVHLFKLKTYHEVVDEIYYQVKHMEPWERGSRKTSGQTGMCGGVRGVGAGGIVSTAYCLLYKLYTLRLTRKQVNGLINHTDSPYIRALGFMYLRYVSPPADLYDWYEDYLQDDEEIDVKAGSGQLITIGQMVYQFLTKLDWFSTLFPRIPVPIQKQIEMKIQNYCRQNSLTVHQLISGTFAANERLDKYEAEEPVTHSVDKRYPKSYGTSERSHNYQQKAKVDEYEEPYSSHRRREDRHSSPESVYRGSSRERERIRQKHKKKHKHHSRSRSRSRSERKKSERHHPSSSSGKEYYDGYAHDRRYK